MSHIAQPPSILLVDDDADTREMYSWSFEARGFRVLPAGSVPAAIALAFEKRPDIIVTDFTLPGDDGFALATKVRESDVLRDTTIILVSGRSFVGGSGERAMQLFDRVLIKPALPDQLLAEMVPLLLDRAAATLERQLRAVQARIPSHPTGSAAGRVLSAVSEVADDPVPAALVADSSARYIAANDAACALIGRPREELLTLSVWDLTPQVSLDASRRQWEAFVSGGTLSGAYHLSGPAGSSISTVFSAAAHVLPGCHLSLLRPLSPVLAVAP